MTLIDGDRIITAQLYDDEYEEFKEEKMSIIDYVNMYTTEGVTTADDVLDKIRAEIKALSNANPSYWHSGDMVDRNDVLEILNKYKAESE